MGGATKAKSAVLNRRGASAASEWQPLIWAAKENHVQIVSILLDLGADINQQQPNTTSLSMFSALHWAAAKGHDEMAKMLVERGINKNLRDKHNNTALMLAEKKLNKAIVEMLS
jgi:ankyrin repeat protein